MARPRDPRADAAILAATVNVLADVGFGRLTVDAVAAEAGCGKATIYRRWPTKEAMVLDALISKRSPVADVDTGDLRSDLRQIYANMVSARSQQTTARLLPALVVEAGNDPELEAQLRAFVADRRNPARAAFQRAVARGELPTDTDVELSIDLITGAVMNRLVFTGAVVDDAYLRRVIDTVLVGLGADLHAHPCREPPSPSGRRSGRSTAPGA